MMRYADTGSTQCGINTPMGRCIGVLVALFALTFLGTCSRAPETEEAMMQEGLNALYTRRDPTAAVAQFRKMLERNPTHYGAVFQLAMALDQAGKPGEARPLWERMLLMAEAAQDQGTADMVRARLPSDAMQSAEESMRAGLDAFYTQRDPHTAIVKFRKVLEQNPVHYGATFQLASALDTAGKRDEARPWWEQVLRMAEGYNDKQTADTARARLAP